MMRNWLFFTFLLMSTHNVFSSDSEEENGMFSHWGSRRSLSQAAKDNSDSEKENIFYGRIENLDGDYGQYSEIDDEMSSLFTSSVSLRSFSRAATDSRSTDNQSPVTIVSGENVLALSGIPAPSLQVVSPASATAATIENDETKTKTSLFKSSAFSAMVLKRPLSIESEFDEKLHSGLSPRSGAKSVSFKDELIALSTEKEVIHEKVQQSINQSIKDVQDRNHQTLIGKRSFYAVAGGEVQEGTKSQKKSVHSGMKRSSSNTENLDKNKKSRDFSSDTDTDPEL